MIDHGMSLINDTLHVNIPDAPEVNKIIYNGVEFVPGTQWIPCSERLPEKLTQVIYSYENYVGFGYTTDQDYNGEKTDLHWEDVESGALIYPEAWMPLPNPYKEEEDG